MPKKKSEHYVNNKELLEAMIVYRTKVEKSYMKTFNKDLTEFPKQERGKSKQERGKQGATWLFSGYSSALLVALSGRAAGCDRR